MKTVLLVGSSIFQQWQNTSDIAPSHHVKNRAIGGTTTTDWTENLADVLQAETPDVVLLYCGSNDLNRDIAEETIIANIARCRKIVYDQSPDTQFAYFGIIKAPQKSEKWALIDRLNRAIQNRLQGCDLYVETNDVFVRDGRAVDRFYVEDRLHLTGEAYAALSTYTQPLMAEWLDKQPMALGGRMAADTVSTVIGTGLPGCSDQQVNNPYGVIIGPDNALYFCDLDNQRIRRLDLETGQTAIIAGNGERGYSGDGGQATAASLNMPHEIQFDAAENLYIVERDNHVVRKVERQTGIISTFAGTGAPGFTGDGGLANQAQLRQPHSIALDPQGRLLICDIGNHRIRRVDPQTEIIETYAGTGEQLPTSDGAPLRGTPLNGPRTLSINPDGNLYLALREGNAIYRINPETETIHHMAGTGEQGYSGDGGPAKLATLAGPKGVAYASGGQLYIVDTENHVIRCIDLETEIISTVLGTGQVGDGPEPDPHQCRLSRPHGIFVNEAGEVYVGDSEAHRIRLLQQS